MRTRRPAFILLTTLSIGCTLQDESASSEDRVRVKPKGDAKSLPTLQFKLPATSKDAIYDAMKGRTGVFPELFADVPQPATGVLFDAAKPGPNLAPPFLIPAGTKTGIRVRVGPYEQFTYFTPETGVGYEPWKSPCLPP